MCKHLAILTFSVWREPCCFHLLQPAYVCGHSVFVGTRTFCLPQFLSPLSTTLSHGNSFCWLAHLIGGEGGGGGTKHHLKLNGFSLLDHKNLGHGILSWSAAVTSDLKTGDLWPHDGRVVLISNSKQLSRFTPSGNV